MATQQKIESNRHNALLSTGPKTATGKAICSRNALKHGLRSRDLLLADECQEELEDLTARLREDLQPSGELEHLLVERIIACIWRLRRASRIEVLFLGRVLKAAKESKYRQEGQGWGHFFICSRGEEAYALQNHINRYETTIERSLYRTLGELKKLQKERRERSEQEVAVVEEDACG